MTVQAGLWWGAGAAALTVVISALAEWRRGKRRNLEAVGWVPWRGLQMAGVLFAIALALLAVRL